MGNSKRGSISMQEKLKLSKSQGASTPAELKRMQNVPYASAVGSIMYAVRCTRPDVAFAQNKGSKQSIFATSSAEAEYIAAFDASKEAVWVRKFISGLGVVPTIEEPISMYCDNTGAIAIANESGITKGSRHFRAKVHYLREVIEYGDIKLEKVHTDDNLADPFTKGLAFPKHSEHTRNIGMLPASSLMYICVLVIWIIGIELEEYLVTHAPDFQNTSEPSNASTNVVNAPREPYVVKEDHWSFVDMIIFDLNRAPDSPYLHTISPNQFRCFHCKDVLRDGEAYKRCTCAKYGSGLGKGLCYICGNNQNSLNDSPSISETSSQSPPNINHCCYECGDPLDGFFCKRCTCKSCGKDAILAIIIHQMFRLSLTQNLAIIKQLMSSHKHCQVFIRHSILKLKVHSLWTQLLLMSMNLLTFSTHLHNLLCILMNFAGTMLIMATIVHLKLRLSIRSRVIIKTLIFRKIFKMSHNNILVVMIAGLLMTLTNLNSTLAKITEQMTSITSLCEMACQVVQKKLEEKQLEEEQAAKAKYWKLPVCYDDDDDEERFDSLDDNIISGLSLISAITPNEPVISTEEPDNSLSMGDEHLDTIPATESDEFIKSGVENLIPIPSDSEEFSSIDDDSFSIDDIDYVEASPPNSELVSSEVMEIVILEVGGIDDDILLTIKYDILHEKLLNVNLLIAKIEALNANPTPSFDCKTNLKLSADVEEISSGSTTSPPDISLLEYEAFHDDHVKEISSGSPTTHSDFSLYASFIFDLSINPFPPVNMSDFYEFTDELIPSYRHQSMIVSFLRLKKTQKRTKSDQNRTKKGGVVKPGKVRSSYSR
nr:zinc finger, CCHC-type [Tanacetum cinerariifolium]